MSSRASRPTPTDNPYRISSHSHNVLVDTLFNSIGDGAIITDESSNIIRINAEALRILGFRQSELIGEWYPRAIIALDDNDNELDVTDRAIYQAFIEGAPVTDKIYYRHKSGQKVPVAVTVSPIILNKRPIGSINVFRDISLEHEVDRMKSEFISLAAHQLRTPLSSIKIYSHMLLDGLIGEASKEQRPALDNIVNSTNIMNTLISTLLNISRMESGIIKATSQAVNIGSLARGCVRDLRLLANDKNIEIILHASRQELTVSTDQTIVKEIIGNYIVNAIKYTPSGGTVTVNVESKDTDIICSVSDTGIGIPDSAQAKIFSKFFRVSNAMTFDPDGTGLGLYLVKGLAEQLGGKVWFDSELNKGSTFYLSLPV